MRALLITLGSHGDIHPFIALARELKRRGHPHLLVTNPYFQPQAVAAGVDFAPLAEGLDLKEVMQMPGVMDPNKGARVVLKQMAAPMSVDMFRRTRELIAEFRPDVCLTHPICFGASWAAQAAGIPAVPVVLSPLCWIGSRDQRVFTGWQSHTPSPFMTRFQDWVGTLSIRLMLDGTLNRYRRELGLPPQRDLLLREFTRGDLVLGLWSPAFRPSREGDPPGGRICGFAWFDHHHDHQESDDRIDDFLQAGDPPIVFSLGSAAVFVAGDFYTKAARAAAALGRRAILLVGRAEYLPHERDLPNGVKAFTYAPFSTLLPRAAAAVHHGGVGSTAQGLRAGRPTVVVPLAHDQFDNAARVKRLGVSQTVPFNRATASRLQAALARVLGEPRSAETAKSLAATLANEDGASVAVDHLESLCGNPKSRRGLSPAP